MMPRKEKSGTSTLCENKSRAQVLENAQCPLLVAWDLRGAHENSSVVITLDLGR